LLGFDCENILYQWNPAYKWYELYPNDFTHLERGRGYLLRLTEDKQPSYDALQGVGDFEIYLPEAGWSWIGHPFDFDLPLAAVLIRNNTTGEVRTAWQDHRAPDAWASWDFLYWWSVRDVWRICGLEAADEYSLHPWYGYLVWANTRDLTLIVPSR
jgi:hypothetical protein